MENILVEGLESFLDQSVDMGKLSLKDPIIALYAVKPREEQM